MTGDESGPGRPVGHRREPRGPPHPVRPRRTSTRSGVVTATGLAGGASRGSGCWWAASSPTASARPPPGGTLFVNLEDETGLINVVVSKGCWTAPPPGGPHRPGPARAGPPRAVRGRHQRHRRPPRAAPARRARPRAATSAERGADGPNVVAHGHGKRQPSKQKRTSQNRQQRSAAGRPRKAAGLDRGARPPSSSVGRRRSRWRRRGLLGRLRGAVVARVADQQPAAAPAAAAPAVAPPAGRPRQPRRPAGRLPRRPDRPASPRPPPGRVVVHRVHAGRRRRRPVHRRAGRGRVVRHRAAHRRSRRPRRRRRRGRRTTIDEWMPERDVGAARHRGVPGQPRDGPAGDRRLLRVPRRAAARAAPRS